MGKALKRCYSLQGTVRQDPDLPAGDFLQAAEHGVWAVAQDLPQGGGGRLLLDVLQEQVAAGEDLIAALLVAHGRVQRELGRQPDFAGTRVISMRLNRHTSSFEIAWVGAMQAHLVRGGEVIQLNRSTAHAADGQSQTNAFQMTAQRVPGLGRPGRVRPIIDRKLGHAESGDMLVLGACGADDAHYSQALRDALKGVWSLDYKLRRLLDQLKSGLTGDLALPVLLWRGK